MTTTTKPKPPMIPLGRTPGKSQTPSPADHVRTLVELLRPAGPDLARRLVAALLLAPVDEREAIVDSIEAKMVELYSANSETLDEPVDAHADEPRMMNVIDAPVQKQGYVEQKIHTYEVKPSEDRGAAGEGTASKVG